MTQEDAGSAPMLGSQEPAAWAAFADDSGETGVTSLNREAVEEVAARMGWQVAALYRKPILTDAERAAIEWAAQMAGNNVYFKECDTLRALLARLK